MKTIFLFLISLTAFSGINAQLSKKERKDYEYWLQSGNSLISIGKKDPSAWKAYEEAIYAFVQSINISKGTIKEPVILFARAVVLDYASPNTRTYQMDQNYYPNYKEEARVKEVDKVGKYIYPLLQRDSSDADPYLALATVSLLIYPEEPQRWKAYYSRAQLLANYDTACMRLFTDLIKKIRTDKLWTTFNASEKENNEKKSFEILEELSVYEQDKVKLYKLTGITQAKYGHYATALNYSDSINYNRPQYEDLISYICSSMNDPKEKFNLFYTKIFTGPGQFMKHHELYWKDILLKYAAEAEQQVYKPMPWADSIWCFIYTEEAYKKAKAGFYYSAMTYYLCAFEEVWEINDNHAFIGYHYNRALAMAMLDNGALKKQALDFIDEALNIYGSDPAAAQLVTLKKKISNQEKLLPTMFIQKPAYYDELYGLLMDSYVKSKNQPKYVNTDKKVPLLKCTVPEYNNLYLEKMNKQAQNDINNWNSVTKNGQLYRQSPQARNAVSRIASTYHEIYLYYSNIKEIATIRRRLCEDKTTYAEFDKVIETCKAMMDNCDAQAKKWGATTDY